MDNGDLVRFLKINNDAVLDYIDRAKKHIIFAKPAFLAVEIEALLKAKEQHNMIIDLYMEPGDKAIRFGFGEKLALDLININTHCFNIQLAERIRMAILCVDNTVLLYAPNLSYMEPETSKLTFANGILCDEAVSKEIIKQFPTLDNKETKSKKISDNVVILPGGYIPDETINKVQDNIARTIKILEDNPAVDPSQLEKISIYRNKYKIVRQEINGIKIENKRLSLRAFNALLPKKLDKLHSSWSIFTREDIDDLQDTKSFWRELKSLEVQYADSLLDAGRFGKLLDIKKRKAYETDIIKLKNDFKEYLGSNPSQEVYDRFALQKNKNEKKIDKKDLSVILDNSRRELEEYLISLCPLTEDFLEVIFRQYRHLRNIYNKHKDREAIVKEFVNIFVLDKLKFTDIDDIINTIDIKVDFYDISDELLSSNEDFKKIIENYEVDLRQTLFGFEYVKRD